MTLSRLFAFDLLVLADAMRIADYRTIPRAIVIEKRIVTAADRLAERIAPGGGTPARFVPLAR